MPRTSYTVDPLATRLDLKECIQKGIATLLPDARGEQLYARLLLLPVRKSHALRSLGSYVSRDGQPSCIRLQFRQAEADLRETLLHELAHACDHLVNQPGERYRRAHGQGWRDWAIAFGIDPKRTGHSRELAEIQQQKLKPVAVCQKCGLVIRRLRRLPSMRRFLHPECGGRIVPLP